jgi:hypothetical protein
MWKIILIVIGLAILPFVLKTLVTAVDGYKTYTDTIMGRIEK